MRKHKIGDHVLVKLSGVRLVQATIKAIIDTTDGVRLQVSFGEQTAGNCLYQVPKEDTKELVPEKGIKPSRGVIPGRLLKML